MIADNTDYNNLVEKISTAYPISDDFLKSLFPVGWEFAPSEMYLAAAMADMGMMQAVIREVFGRARHMEARQ